MGDAKLAKILLDHGADPNLTKNDHTTPLMVAAGVGLGAVRGEDPSLLHPNEEGGVEIIKMLLARGADINASNDVGTTALHGAVTRSQGLGNGTSEKIIQTLADNGIILDAKDKRGRTPLDLARSGQGVILNRASDSSPAGLLLPLSTAPNVNNPTQAIEKPSGQQ
jgi:ankyrin repeat protein